MNHKILNHDMIDQVYTRLINSTMWLAEKEMNHNEATAALEQAKVNVTNAGLEGSNADLRKAYLLDRTELERLNVTITKEELDNARTVHEVERLTLRTLEMHARLAEILHEDKRLRVQGRGRRRRSTRA